MKEYVSVGENIKRLRQDKGFTQQRMAELIGAHRSNYPKVESGKRELSLAALKKLARYFDISLDALVDAEGPLLKEVTVKDKTALEQLKLIDELDADDRAILFKLIDTFLTKKKFKDFFQKNIADL